MAFVALLGGLAGAVVMALSGAGLGALSGSLSSVAVLAMVFGGLGAFIGFALALLMQIRDRVTASERRIQALIAAAGATASSEPAPSQPTPKPKPLWRPPPPAASKSSERPASPASPSVFSDWARRAKTWLTGGNTIARVGILVLFVGATLLAKYAAESGLFPLEARLAAVALLGMGLLGLGWRLRHRHTGYALILQGGGVAILYLTLYASFRLFELLSAGPAFALMVAVALSAAVLAVAQNAVVLAVIGFAGGFLAPLLTASGGGSHIGLFSYYTVLNLGVFAVAWFRAWRSLNVLGFVFTFAVSALWRGGGYAPAHLISTDGFLILFFLMYVAVSLLLARRQSAARVDYVSGTLVFGLPVVAFALHASLVADIEFALAWSALVLAVFYLLLALWLFRLPGPAWRLLAEAFAALGVIFASLTVPLALSSDARAAVWAVEGAGLLWLGTRQGRRLARLFGVMLQVLAAIAWGQAVSTGDMAAAAPIFNGPFLAAAGLAVAGYLSGLFLFRMGAARAGYERGAAPALLAWSVLWALIAGVAEVAGFAPGAVKAAWLLAVPTLVVALLALLGQRLTWPASFRLAPLLAAGFLAGATLLLATLSHPLARGGWLGWPVLWLAYYGVLWRRDRDSGAWLASLTPWLHALGLWTLALILIRELPWWINRSVSGVWPALAWGLVPAGLLVLCARAPAVWPWRVHARAYRWHGAVPLAAVAALWVVVMNLGHDGDPGPLPYWPLLNPLDIGMALTLLAGMTWWRAVKRPSTFAMPVWAPLIFLWLSASLVRALHYAAGTPLDAEGMLRSVTVQMALSLFWAALGFAAMVTATRRGWRRVWISGAVLLGVVVVKLFVVDLAGTETLARTVSFLGVGLVLLVVGYFSPLPPHSKESS